MAYIEWYNTIDFTYSFTIGTDITIVKTYTNPDILNLTTLRDNEIT